MAKTVKVAMIGSGGMAKAHLPGLKDMKDVEIVGFCDVNLERAKTLADENGGAAFDDAGAMLDATQADCCYVLLPPFAHGKAEMACVDRGVPFFVEKPINKNWKQACGIAEAVADKGLMTSAGYMNRYRKGIQTAKKLLAKDPAVYVWGGWIGGSPPPVATSPIGAWWVQKAMSGGQFVEQVTHTVDLVRFLCGEAVEVAAFAAQGFNKGIQNYDIDDAMAVSIKFANGGVCNLVSCCASGARGGVTLDLYAPAIAFKFEGWGHDCTILRPGKDPEQIPGSEDIFRIEDEAFIKAVRAGNDKGILCSYGDALKTLEICLAANTAAEKEKVVKLTA
jgi:myo-inositol 2-dehydrogenase / D-chiro-inositol 1-dehydrogenase